MNTDLLKEMIEQGYVEVQKHPEQELYIYNYTQIAQYDRIWNEVTLMCRGLMLNEQGQIVARPFPKFFNLGEHENQEIPNEPFEVYEKMDGSLGILYWCDNGPCIATRGSFTSIQSQKANEMLLQKYHETLEQLDQQYTYLFEIIYPENRIVVDYGSKEQLVLLAIVETATGDEMPLVDIGFPIVKRYDGLQDLEALREIQEDNKEGFVVKFKSGLRYKIKFEEYVRIHRIITQVSTISIWEYLKEGKQLGELLERVPDEFYAWVRKTNDELLGAFLAIEQKAKEDYKVLDGRKETAEYFKTCTYPAVMFRMLDGRTYDEIIWKMLRPKFSKPFVNIEVDRFPRREI